MRLVSTRSWIDWGFNLKRAGIRLGLVLGFALVTTPALYLLMDQQPVPANPITGLEIVAVLFAHFLVLPLVRQEALVMRAQHEFWEYALRVCAALPKGTLVDMSMHGLDLMGAAPKICAAVARDFLDRH